MAGCRKTVSRNARSSRNVSQQPLEKVFLKGVSPSRLYGRVSKTAMVQSTGRRRTCDVTGEINVLPRSSLRKRQVGVMLGVLGFVQSVVRVVWRRVFWYLPLLFWRMFRSTAHVRWRTVRIRADHHCQPLRRADPEHQSTQNTANKQRIDGELTVPSRNKAARTERWLVVGAGIGGSDGEVHGGGRMRVNPKRARDAPLTASRRIRKKIRWGAGQPRGRSLLLLLIASNQNQMP